MESKRERNIQIDNLKGIAMILIVIYHFFCRYNQLYSDTNINLFFINYWGVIGVTIFLVVSGYFMCYSKGGIKFLEKKIVRLWPIYFIAISICFIATSIWELEGRSITLMDYFLNIPWINGFIGTPYVDSAHWYITAILGCIIMYSMILTITHGKKQLYFYIVWILWILLLVSVNTYLLKNNSIIRFFIAISGGYYAPMLVSGTALRLFKDKKNKRQSLILCLICVMVTMTIQSVSYALVLVGTVVLVGCVNKFNLKILQFKSIATIGMASYSIYVIHQNIGYVVIQRLSILLGHYNIVFSMVATVIMIISGLLLYEYIEKPIIYYGKRFKKRKNNIVRGDQL